MLASYLSRRHRLLMISFLLAFISPSPLYIDLHQHSEKYSDDRYFCRTPLFPLLFDSISLAPLYHYVYTEVVFTTITARMPRRHQLLPTAVSRLLIFSAFFRFSRAYLHFRRLALEWRSPFVRHMEPDFDDITARHWPCYFILRLIASLRPPLGQYSPRLLTMTRPHMPGRWLARMRHTTRMP